MPRHWVWDGVWGGVELGHMVDATALGLGWGVGMLTFNELAHMVDATPRPPTTYVNTRLVDDL